MKRTQIALTEQQHRMAKRKSAELQVSLGEYIRRLVERDTAVQRPEVDVTAVFDLGSSGGGDVRRDKDAMVDDAVAGGDGDGAVE